MDPTGDFSTGPSANWDSTAAWGTPRVARDQKYMYVYVLVSGLCPLADKAYDFGGMADRDGRGRPEVIEVED